LLVHVRSNGALRGLCEAKRAENIERVFLLT